MTMSTSCLHSQIFKLQSFTSFTTPSRSTTNALLIPLSSHHHSDTHPSDTHTVRPPWYCLFQTERTIKHPDPRDGILKPSMDLDTDDDGQTVTATFELPGVKKEDLNIDVYHGVLWISGKKREKERQGNNTNAHSVHERQFEKFMRNLHLPQGVKLEEIKASMEDGVLVLSFPNHEHGVDVGKVAVA